MLIANHNEVLKTHLGSAHIFQRKNSKFHLKCMKESFILSRTITKNDCVLMNVNDISSTVLRLLREIQCNKRYMLIH